MDLFVTPYIYYYTACLMYVLSAVICGTVRWFHMCRPYDRKAEYFYPGRRQGTFFYIMLVLQLPYLLHPVSAEAWMFVRTFGILYYPLCFSMLLLRYFRGEKRHKRMRRAVLTVPPAVLMLLWFAEGVSGRTFTGGVKQVLTAVTGLAALWLTVYQVRLVWWLKRQIHHYQRNRYSNEEDFPYKFASRILYVPIAWSVLMWMVFLSDSPGVKAVVDLSCTVMHVWLLIEMLHPHWGVDAGRAGAVEERQNILMDEILQIRESDPAESLCPDNCGEDAVREGGKTARLTPEQQKELQEKVITLIREEGLFAIPTLKIGDIADRVNSNSSYIYEAFMQGRDRQGTFYQIVNRMRVEYCQKLLAENPDIDPYKLLERSGFSSQSTYYRVFKAFTGMTPKAWIRNLKDRP